MKTTYTLMAILVTLLFSQATSAKLADNRANLQFENQIDLNVENEIVNNINEMLLNLEIPEIKTDVTKQLGMSTVELQTNELVQDTGEKLPEFKFKVVFTD